MPHNRSNVRTRFMFSCDANLGLHKTMVYVNLSIWHTKTERGADSCCSVPLFEALALPWLSEWATLKAPRRWIYNLNQRNIIIPRGVPVALSLTTSLRICEIPKSQNQSVTENACFNMSFPAHCRCLPIRVATALRRGSYWWIGRTCVTD